MSLSRGIGMNEALILLCIRCTIVLLATNNKYAEAVFVWTAPPPAWNQTVQGADTVNIQTAVFEVLNGSVNYQLRWNYTLLDGQSILLVTFAIADGIGQSDDIGVVVGGNPTIYNRNDYPSRFSIESTSEYSTLTISTVAERENATFQCKISLTEGSSWAYNARIFITAPSKINHTSDNQTVNQNDEVHLNCTADGLPAPTIFWTRLSNNSNVSMPLNIRGRKDQGGYRCTAYNDVGDPDTADVFITVQNFSPERTILTSSLTENNIALVNTTFNINCSTEANPPAEFRFYRDGINLRNTTTGNNVAVFTTSVSERRRPVTYSCIPVNEYGDGPTATITVTVYFLPKIDSAPSDEKVVEGSSLNLFCNATGNPEPDITWTKEGESSVLSTSETLELTNLSSEDNGAVYICKVNNNLGFDEAIATITVFFAPNVTLRQCPTVVNENHTTTLYCNATGNPAPSIKWIRRNTGEVMVVSNNSSLEFEAINRNESGLYQCIANNSIGNDSKNCAVDVQFPPKIVTSPSDKKVVEGSSLNLFCNATGNPQPDITWIKEGESSVQSTSETLKLTNLSSKDNGQVYICKVNNSLGFDEANTTITVLFAPTATLYQCPTSNNESNNATFYCNATGNPAPSIEWVRENSGEVVSNDSTLVLWTINRNKSGRYQCIASNRIGNDTKNCTVKVDYRPKIVKPTSSEVSELLSSSITVECLAEGSPDPWYVWTNVADGSETRGGNLTIENVNDLNGRNYTYTCTATNDLGYDKRTVSIEITRYRIRVRMVITKVDGEDAFCKNETEEEVKKQVGNEYGKSNYSDFNRTAEFNCSNGSIIAFFVILFNTPVTLKEGLEPLFAAVANRTLGPFTVESLRAIEDVSPTPIPSDSPTSTGSTTATVTPVDNTASSPVGNTASSPVVDGPPWGIIGGAIGAVVVVIIIIILVACWVHKKRKCRKDTKIHNSESEVLQGQNDIEDGVHAKVNGGYADAGPPSANGTNRFVQPQPEQQQQQAAAAPPDYAVADKSKKKNKDNNNGNKNIPDYAVVDKSKKKKNKKAEAEDPYAEVEDPKKDTDKKTADPSTLDYAVVNKSKKKKKEEDENAYATVDKSKKSKKKPKAPGEVLYADLDDFKPVQAPSMPTVSTSPEPLAPLKRPPSYQATEYADITQFLKGNATLPEGQSTEMQPTYANAGGGQGVAANKENANTGGEGGGGDTEPKETPM